VAEERSNKMRGKCRLLQFVRDRCVSGKGPIALVKMN
jgi:hypothetical protein